MVVDVYLNTLEMVINYDLTLLSIDFVADIKLNEKTFSIVHNSFGIRSYSVSVIPFFNLNIVNTDRASREVTTIGFGEHYPTRLLEDFFG